MSGLETRVRRLERILELSHELTFTTSLDPLLRRIMQAAAELTDSESAGILLLDETAGNLRFVAATNFTAQLAEISVPVEGSIAGTAFSTGEPLIVSDVRADPRYYKVVEEKTGYRAHSLLAVPLQFKERRIGVLEAENKLGGQEFNQEDVETLTALAAHATVAIENARLLEALQEARDGLERRVDERTAELSNANTALKQQIAARAQADEALRRRNRELAATAIDKARLVEALRQQTEALQAQNEELDAFAHTVAHDLRNPLNLITGFAEVLRNDFSTMSDEDLYTYLDTIARNGRKMNKILHALLLLAGVRQMEVEMAALDMASIAAEALQRLDIMIEEHRADIVLPDTWPVALGYGPWVEEVWFNYLSNAIQYGGQPPCVELGFDRVERGQAPTLPPAGRTGAGMLRFWVRDNGAGISPEAQSRLFTPFTRLDQAKGKGHGLGLSIARRIVEKLGGQVGVESPGIPGQGSVFHFTLPAERS